MSFRLLTARVTAVLAFAATASPLAAQPVASFAPAPGSATIDFNSLTHGDIVTNQYYGITVSGGLCANSDYSSFLFADDPMQVSNARS